MKTCSIVVVVLFFTGSTGRGLRVSAAKQSGTEANAGQTRTETPNPSSMGMFYVLAEFTGSLNVKKLKPGDRVKAMVTQDVLSHGRIIIPEESKLLGHVTEVKARGQEDTESRLGIVFDKVLLKHHEAMDFQGVVQALAPPVLRKSKVDEPDPMIFPASRSPVGQTSPLGGGGPSANRNTCQRTNDSSLARAATTVPNVPIAVSYTTKPNPA